MVADAAEASDPEASLCEYETLKTAEKIQQPRFPEMELRLE